MKTRTKVKPCVLSLLESSIRERFRYPQKTLNEDFVKIMAEKLELSAYDYSQSFTDIVETTVVGGVAEFNITESLGSKGEPVLPKDEDSYDAYISNVATLVIHISPEFYTGRNSFTFRDRLAAADVPLKLMNMDRSDLWPEFFANDYLLPEELDMVELQREVERNIAVSGLLAMIDQCCGGNVCTYDERKDFLKFDGGGGQGERKNKGNKSSDPSGSKSLIFHEGSPFTTSQNYVCFGKGSTCWEKSSNKIVLPCDGTVCQKIPDAAKTLYNSTNGYKYFSTCMMYEDFLRAFAYQGIEGSVPDPTDPTKEIDDTSLDLIRKRYKKELKMMRRYLDLNLSE